MDELKSIKFAVKQRIDASNWSIRISLENGRDPYHYRMRLMALEAVMGDIEWIENRRKIKSTPIKKSNYRIVGIICRLLGHRFNQLTLSCKTCKVSNEELIRK